jgi:hypothetical protein
MGTPEQITYLNSIATQNLGNITINNTKISNNTALIASLNDQNSTLSSQNLDFIAHNATLAAIILEILDPSQILYLLQVIAQNNAAIAANDTTIANNNSLISSLNSQNTSLTDTNTTLAADNVLIAEIILEIS